MVSTLAKRIVPDDLSLELVRDAESYLNKQFVLTLTDGDGRTTEVVLDGIQVGDIIADARDGGGLPVQFPCTEKRPAGAQGERVPPGTPQGPQPAVSRRRSLANESLTVKTKSRKMEGCKPSWPVPI